MHKSTPAIDIERVVKRYSLYRSPLDAALEALKIQRLFFWRQAPTSYEALSDVSITVKRGERVAIIGRNGAGKTTLLKLIAGRHLPTEGSVQVNGKVCALMDLGVGFHPDFSGYDNIRSALSYNGLSQEEVAPAIDDIVEFCELGDFLHQPLSTYSAGMRARLYFAAATAIKPEVLIVDEVLGAGDSYFAARSAARMRLLANSGCTLLLVSHSMQQVLEFCDRAIWLEAGSVVMDGPCLAVVKAYEQFIQLLTAARHKNDRIASGEKLPVTQQRHLKEWALAQATANEPSGDGQKYTVGGISRWPSNGKLKISDSHVVCIAREAGALGDAGKEIVIDVAANTSGAFICRYIVVIFTEDGRWVTRLVSPPHRLTVSESTVYSVRVRLAPVYFQPGEYVYSLAIMENVDPWDVTVANRYDLVSRSYRFVVDGERIEGGAIINHPVSWDFRGAGSRAASISTTAAISASTET